MQLPVFLLIDTGHNSRLYSTVDVTKFSYFNYCVYSVMSFMVLKQADSRPDGPSRIIHVHVYSSTTLLLWHCCLGHQTCKNRRPCNLYCVGADVKPCSINQSSHNPLALLLVCCKLINISNRCARRTISTSTFSFQCCDLCPFDLEITSPFSHLRSNLPTKCELLWRYNCGWTYVTGLQTIMRHVWRVSPNRAADFRDRHFGP